MLVVIKRHSRYRDAGIGKRMANDAGGGTPIETCTTITGPVKPIMGVGPFFGSDSLRNSLSFGGSLVVLFRCAPASGLFLKGHVKNADVPK